MKFVENYPIYKQIEEYLKLQIVTKNVLPGEKLPSVRQLAVSLTVNVHTIQRALSSMTDEGILETKRGLGNFVTKDIVVIENLKKELIQNEMDHIYQKLTSLGLSDEAILKELTQFMAKKGDENG